MQHGHAGKRNIDGATHSPVRRHDHVLDMIHPLLPGVHHGVHLTGHRVEFRVSGEAPRQCSVEVVATDRFEFVRQLDWAAARLDHCPRGPGETADVGIRTDSHPAPVGSWNIGLTAPGTDRRRPDVPIAIPLGPTVTKSDAVDHSVTHEPVVGERVDVACRVRSVAQVAAVQFGWHFTLDRQIPRGDLLGDRGVVAREVQADVSAGGFGHRHSGPPSVARRNLVTGVT